MSNNFSIKCGPQQMKLIEEHCFSETEVEVGGFLVGLVGEDETLVSNVFPAQHSVGASTQLTFTHESWNALYDQLKNEPEGTTLVGWYHSHPNFGVFLSEHDKFIQSNFFKQDGNVTIVVDPIKGRKGWFYSKKGKIEKYKHETDTDRPRLGVSSTDSAANIGAKLGGGGVSIKTVIAISAVMSLLSFVLGWTTTSLTSGGGGASQASVSDLTARVAKIEAYLQQNAIAAPQVATKPKAQVGPKSSQKPTAKSSSKPSTKKATPAAKNPKAVKGTECKSGQTDAKYSCTLSLDTNKFTWTDPKPKTLESSKPSSSPTNSSTPTTASSSAKPSSTPTPSPSNS
jgi:proteasome lid subunit RPN8/RPN11